MPRVAKASSEAPVLTRRRPQWRRRQMGARPGRLTGSSVGHDVAPVFARVGPPSLQPPIPADARTTQSPATPPSRGQPAAAPERESLGVWSQWAGRQVYTQQKTRLRRWGCSAARHSSVGAQQEGTDHRSNRACRRTGRHGLGATGSMFNGRTLGRRECGASAQPRRMIRPHLPETGPCLTVPAGEPGGAATTAALATCFRGTTMRTPEGIGQATDRVLRRVFCSAAAGRGTDRACVVTHETRSEPYRFCVVVGRASNAQPRGVVCVCLTL